jgi:hypothetical protein
VAKAVALWRRLAELFGADALARKFGDTPPETWVVAVDALNEFQLERGMRRLVYGGKSIVPTLPEFLRMCREVGGTEWTEADGLRAPPSHRIEQQPMPRWMREANIHLIAYITRRGAAGFCYHGEEEVQPLYKAKNAWADDMLQAELDGNLPRDNGRQWWDGAMRYAEEALERIRGERRRAA